MSFLFLTEESNNMSTSTGAGAPNTGVVNKSGKTGFVMTSKGSPINDSIDRELMADAILPNVDFEASEERENDKGVKYHTTRAFSWNVEDNQYRYQIGLSVNRFPKSAKGASGDTGLKLTANERRVIDLLVGKISGAKPELAAQLATLKGENKLTAADVDLIRKVAQSEGIGAEESK